MKSEVNYKNLTRLRMLAWMEGVSFLLLLGIGMPLKYMYQMPHPNLIIGMAHGILFIAYCMMVMLVMKERNWRFNKTFMSLLAAFLPFGTFVADAKIFRKEILH